MLYEVITKDMELMKKAHLNAVAIGMFSWSSLETEEGVFDFSWLDEVMDNLAENKMFAMLSTPSGAVITSYSIHYTKLYDSS